MRILFRHKKYLLSFLLALSLLSCVFSAAGLNQLYAEGLVGMESPDDVQRGQSFKVTITATGAAGGVDGVQLYLYYDANAFTFVKANSTLLEASGDAISSGTDVPGLRNLTDNGSFVNIIAYGNAYNCPNNIVAQLEFMAKADAPINKASLVFKGDSFVSVVGVGKVKAVTDKLTLEVVEANVAAQGQAEPYQPSEPVGEAGVDPGLEQPFDPNNQLAPVEADPNAAPGDYGVDSLNGDGPAAETTPAETSAKPKPTPKPSEAATTAEKKDLLTVNGQKLNVPAAGLPPEQIPKGFQGGSEEILNQQCPRIASAEKNLKLYYLELDGKASFYTYDSASQRFKAFDMKTLEGSKQEKDKSAFRAKDGAPSTWLILALSLLGLTSLSVMLFTLFRNLRR